MPRSRRTLGGSDAGQVQQLGAVERTRGDDHLATRAHDVLGGGIAGLDVGDADRALAIEQDAGGVRADADVEIAASGGGPQEGARGADAPAVLDQPLHVADAGLRGAVVVGVARDAEAGDAVDEGFHERLAPVGVGDGQQAVAAAVVAVDAADAPLRALEVGQDVGVAPAAVAGLRPGVEVGGVAAIVDHAVDGARPAERAALRYEDGAVGGAGAGLRLELPGDARVEQDLDDAARNADHGVGVLRPGLQKADGNGGVFGQAIGEHAARGPGADDHVVELVRVRPNHARVSLSRLSFVGSHDPKVNPTI